MSDKYPLATTEGEAIPLDIASPKTAATSTSSQGALAEVTVEAGAVATVFSSSLHPLLLSFNGTNSADFFLPAGAVANLVLPSSSIHFRPIGSTEDATLFVNILHTWGAIGNPIPRNIV